MAHTFTFYRLGGFDQVHLATAADLAAIGELDRKLWAALACPVQGLEFDEQTLALIDSDQDGRVRAPEIIAAVNWSRDALVDLGAIIAGRPRLPLAAIKPGTPQGAAMLACAKRVLGKTATPDSPDIGLDELVAASGALAKTPFNGDGIVPPAAVQDPLLLQAVNDILTTRPGAADRSGEVGLDKACLAGFASEAAVWLAWWDAAQLRGAELLPMGEATTAASAAVEAVRAKVDDFFVRCAAAAFDARAGVQLARSDADWAAVAAKPLGDASDLAGFPIATVRPGAELPLTAGINPAWSAAVGVLRSAAVEPLLGARATLSEADWRTICARLEAYRAWRTTEVAGAAGKLGPARLRELLAVSTQAALTALIAQDEVVKPEFEALGDLERLIRYHRDLFRLLNNFISFADVYDPKRQAVFQSGMLYLDSRSSELCVRVGDMGRHGLLAGKSNAFLVYAECARGATKMTICAAMTNGDAEGLFVGRNGMFIDRKGQDWDATVVKVVENPISIREAFWTPYRRVARFIEDYAAKRAADADKAVDGRLSQAVTSTAAVADGSKPPIKPKIEVGTVAALGVAFGGITTAIGLMLNAFFGLGYWIPIGLVGLILAISGPSMILAWLKLRRRTIGPILDANGWAVNGNLSINIPFGTTLTSLASLPPGSVRKLDDPYAEKPRPWKTWLFVLLLLAAGGWLLFDRLTTGSYCWNRPKPAAPLAPLAPSAPAAPAAPVGPAAPAAPAAPVESTTPAAVEAPKP